MQSTHLEQIQLEKTHPLGEFLRANIPEPFATLFNLIVAAVCIVALVSFSVLFLVWLERKICARFQARIGPNRVGPFGLLQTVADGIKLFLKEGLRPRGSDAFAYYLAPLLPLISVFLSMSVLPFDHNLQISDPQAGVLFLAAVSGLGVFGILLAGWSSNNKYSLLGGMRAAAQILSYEISLTLIFLFIVVLSGTASLREVVFSQAGTILDWWIFKIPLVGLLAFLLFLISSTAELNRGPFDMAEAESELTGGYHTEYTGIRFALFFLAEYAHLLIASLVGATFFLGGFLAPAFGIPGLEFIDRALAQIPGFLWLMLKAFVLIVIYMWFRWSLPRLRVDQLLDLEWKFLLPMTLLTLALGTSFLGLGWILP